MAKNSKMNPVFGSAVALLAAAALFGMYLNRNQPVIADAPAPEFGSARLPEGHPPVDTAARITAAEQLTRDNPQSAQYRSELGNAYYDAGQYDKAVRAYIESLKLQPDNPSVETDLATSYHYLGQNDQALQLLDKVLKQNPGFGQALFNKGVVLQVGKKDIAGAVAAWEQLLQADPAFARRADLERKIGELKSRMK
jgi:cytochrome c-type biogenesis protein CcmH/NrfG